MITIAHYENLMDCYEASEYVGLAYGTFVQQYPHKKIEPLRIAGRVLFQKGELDRYLERAAAEGLQSARAAIGTIRAAEERRAAEAAGK